MNYPTYVLQKIQSHTGLCVGLDPSTELLRSWGLKDDLSSLELFSHRMVNICLKTEVGFVKPQSAFYERFGWAGLRVLTDINKVLRQAGVFTVLDVKRGDICSTAAAYADAYLSDVDNSKFNAMTVNPFLGYGGLQPFINKLASESVGIFIVVRSSNPDSHVIQEAQVQTNMPVSVWLANRIRKDNAALFGMRQLGSVGAVVGATLSGIESLLTAMPTSFFLCPGIGPQGATINDAVQRFQPYIKQCIFPMSRLISFNRPKEDDLIQKVLSIKQLLAKAIGLL